MIYEYDLHVLITLKQKGQGILSCIVITGCSIILIICNKFNIAILFQNAIQYISLLTYFSV